MPPATPRPDAAPVPGLDLAAVLRWLDDAAPGLLEGAVSAELIAGGRSNLTYLLTAAGTRGATNDDPDGGAGTRVVLRRPPLGHVLATAHDMGREARAIRALAGTAVPVPAVHAWCQDADVTGAPFYVMSYVDGLVVRGAADLAGLDDGGRRRLARAMVEVLAELHHLDVEALGLGDWARPGYLSRQLRRWSAQLEASRSRDLAGIDELRRRLETGLPTSGRTALVHGDYRLDNLVLDRSTRTVLAVLDWEMSTVGDPLADLGLLTAYWDGLGSMTGTGFDVIGPASGFPDGTQLARWYAAHRGDAGHSDARDSDPRRSDPRAGQLLDDLPWYVAFGYFKIAVIFEGIHYRHVTGGTVGEGFGALGPLVPAMVDLGLATSPA